jgi:hypothetical protein
MIKTLMRRAVIEIIGIVHDTTTPAALMFLMYCSIMQTNIYLVFLLIICLGVAYDRIYIAVKTLIRLLTLLRNW